MRLEVDVVLRRGPIAESRHRVTVAVCGAGGSGTGPSAPGGADPAAAGGPADPVTTFRSAAKPFQLLPLVERHAERWGWSDEQLAVMCASHTGSAYHAGLVRGVLERIGCTERDLVCGYHEPQDPESREHLAAHPEDRSPIWNNCSGKHAGMLCLARSEGWPIEGYHLLAHPVQQLMRRTVAELCGMEPGELLVAIDGCSVCVFGLPLSRMACAYARLAAARGGGDARDRALARIRGAMTAFPVAVGGEGRLGTMVMQATRGRLVVKGGAEGLQCAGIPERGLGLALKCEDGAARATGPATVAVLEHLGELSAAELEQLAVHRRPRITNHAGLDVGFLDAVVRAPIGVSE